MSNESTVSPAQLSIDEFFAIADNESWWMDWETWRSLIKHFSTGEILDDDSGYDIQQTMNATAAKEGYNRCTVKIVAEPPKAETQPQKIYWLVVRNGTYGVATEYFMNFTDIWTKSLALACKFADQKSANQFCQSMSGNNRVVGYIMDGEMPDMPVAIIRQEELPKEKPWQDKWQPVANAPAAKGMPSTDENSVIQSGSYKGDTPVTAKSVTEFKLGAFAFLMTSCTDIPPVISTMDGEIYDWISTDMSYAICDKFYMTGKVEDGEPVVARFWPKSNTDSVYQTQQSRTHDKGLSPCSKYGHLRLPDKHRARLAAADWITKNGQTHTVEKGTLVEYEPGWKNVSSLTTDDGTVSVYWVEATILEGPHQGEKIMVTSLNLAAENV